MTEHFGDRESKSFSENIGSEKKKEVHEVKRELRKDLHHSQVSGNQGKFYHACCVTHISHAHCSPARVYTHSHNLHMSTLTLTTSIKLWLIIMLLRQCSLLPVVIQQCRHCQ